MNNNQFRKQEFEKRRVFKKGTSLCNAYSCPIFQNCLLEIKQLQQENARLKDKIDRINKLLNEPIFEYDNIPCNIENEITQLKDILKEN